MMRRASVFVVALTLLIHCNGDGLAGGQEEISTKAGKKFNKQNARAAVNITGKVYLKVTNLNVTAGVNCLFSERKEMHNRTDYLFTLGATPPDIKTYLVTFNTTVKLSKTKPRADKYDAMTYQFRLTEAPKLWRVKHIDRNRSCLVIVEGNDSSDDKKCQLLQPAAHANYSIPEECEGIFNKECPGPNVTLYHSWCQGLPEYPYNDVPTPPVEGCV